jgi:putative DNA primase/helicase
MNYTRNEEELEKILGGYALKGSPFICLDNVPTMRPFGGGPLDRVLTARDKVDLRVLGRSEVLTISWRSVVMATGNNMSLYGDTARRVLMARLEPQDENPERRRGFTYDDLLAHVRDQRGRLVSAALLLLRAYFLAGTPDMGCERWGSFEEWSRLIPHAIVFAGGEDPMRARPARDEDVDAETQAIKCFIAKVHEMHRAEPFRLSDLIEQLFGGPSVPESLKDIRDAIEVLVPSKGRAPDARELGKRLGAFRGRVIDGLRIDSFAGRGGTMRWRITAVV